MPGMVGCGFRDWREKSTSVIGVLMTCAWVGFRMANLQFVLEVFLVVAQGLDDLRIPNFTSICLLLEQIQPWPVSLATSGHLHLRFHLAKERTAFLIELRQLRCELA